MRSANRRLLATWLMTGLLVANRDAAAPNAAGSSGGQSSSSVAIPAATETAGATITARFAPEP